MTDRTWEQSHHHALVQEAKDHLGLVPGHLRGGLARYFDMGVEPGRFLCAVLENDLVGAALRCSGDAERVDVTLTELCSFLYNFAPSGSHGSREKRIAWQAAVSRVFAPVVPELETVERVEVANAT